MSLKPELNTYVVNNRQLLEQIKEALLCLERNSSEQENANANQLSSQAMTAGRVAHDPSLNAYIAESRGLLKEIEDALLCMTQIHDDQESLNAIHRAACAAADRSRKVIAILKRSQLRVITGGLAIHPENTGVKHGS